MGKMTVDEIRKAYLDGRNWLHSYFEGKVARSNMYEFQLFVVVLAQFLYGTFGTLCDFSNKRRTKHLVIAEQLQIHVPLVGVLIGQIVNCRNKICHENGTQHTRNLVDTMYKRRSQILKLLQLCDSYYGYNHIQRLAILADLYQGIDLSKIASLVPSVVWDDPIELLNSLKIVIKDLYNIE